MTSKSFFIVGTDTGVGKTVVSLLCMQLLCRNGFTPSYVKPFQTGCADIDAPGSDARFIRTHLRDFPWQADRISAVYCLRHPKAPYFAARDEGKQIDLHRVFQQLDQLMHDNTTTHLIIEGAGGVLVPVTADQLLVAVVRSVTAEVILVARAGLGTINHTLLSLEALAQRDIFPKSVVMVDEGPEETPEDLVRENIEAIETFSGISPAGVIGMIGDFRTPADTQYQVIERALTHGGVKNGINGRTRPIGHR